MSYERKGMGVLDTSAFFPGAQPEPFAPWMQTHAARATCNQIPGGSVEWSGRGSPRAGCVATGATRPGVGRQPVNVAYCCPPSEAEVAAQKAAEERLRELRAVAEQRLRSPGGSFPGLPSGVPPLTQKQQQGRECQAAGGRIQTLTGRSMGERLACPEGSLWLESFNAAGPGVRTHIPGLRCCFPPERTELPAATGVPWYKHPAVMIGGGAAAALVAVRLFQRREVMRNGGKS